MLTSRSIPERTKPFRLVKYFSLSSLVLIFLGTIVLSVLNTHWIRSMQYAKSEDYALLLIENLNHQVFMQFLLPVGLTYGKIALRDKEQRERMDRVVRTTLHSFKVKMVNIYTMQDQIAYSFSEELVGLKNLGGTDYNKAINGDSTSKLVQKGSFWQLFLGIPDEIRIVTFAPLRAESPFSPEVLGVFEIVQDLTDDYRRIFRFQILTLITVSAVMSVLFVVMLFVVKRGESIIQKRAEERLKLEEQLSRTKHLSTLGEMVAGVSHEIRNPLGIISSSAELLNKKMGPEDPMAQITDIIIQESSRLNNIITDFLNFARPKAPNLYPSRIVDIIAKNISFLSSQLEQRGFRIETRFEANSVMMDVDADMLYQAFLNILINAMQAMPEGGTITIKTKSAQQSLWIAFEDEGEGVSQQAMEKIWDPFFTTKEKGTGLGLGIVKNIIEAHEGQIRLENRKDGGVRVSIRLPIHEEQ